MGSREGLDMAGRGPRGSHALYNCGRWDGGVCDGGERLGEGIMGFWAYPGAG